MSLKLKNSAFLSKNALRRRISNIYCPVVVVLATEEAKKDLEDASGLTSNDKIYYDLGQTVFNLEAVTAYTPNDILTAHTRAKSSSISFAHLFRFFGAAPNDTSTTSAPLNSKYEFVCPKNVNIRLGDKIRTLDYFPVRFLDISECRVISSVEADCTLLSTVSDNQPPLEKIRFYHRLHGYHRNEKALFSLSHKRQPNSSQSHTNTDKKSSLETNIVTNSETKSNEYSPFASSIPSVRYPHSEIRMTHTYRHSRDPNCCEYYDSPKTEAELTDLLYHSLPGGSCVESDAETIPTVWYEAWIDALCQSLNFSDHETLSQPLGCIFIASTRESNPVSCLERLAQESTLTSLRQRLSFDLSHVVRNYVLVHYDSSSSNDTNEVETNESNNNNRINQTLDMIKAAFPPNNCHLLVLDSPNTIDKKNAFEDENKQLFYEDHNIYGHSSLRTLPLPLKKFVFAHYEILKNITNTVIQKTVLPSIERLIKHLNDNLSQNRKGLRNQLRGLWSRKSRTTGIGAASGVMALAETALDQTTEMLWGIGGTTLDDSTTTSKGNRDLAGTSEMKGRWLADLNFFLGDYAQAVISYRTSINEFKHSRPPKFTAGALEMLGISLFLTNAPRSEIESAFSQALSIYSEGEYYRLALRSQVIATRILMVMDGQTCVPDVAQKYEALSCDILVRETFPLNNNNNTTSNNSENLEGHRQIWLQSCSLRAALLLEQAAKAYEISGPRFSRKICFYLVLAGHAFVKSGFKAHGLRCYSIVLRIMARCNWRYTTDYALFSVARQSNNLLLLSDALLAFGQLLNNIVTNCYSEALSRDIPLYCRMDPFGGRRLRPDHISQNFISLNPLRTNMHEMSNHSREATYLKEFLYVFKAWDDRHHYLIQQSESDQNKQRKYINALRALHFEISLPLLKEETVRSYLESDLDLMMMKHNENNNELENNHHNTNNFLHHNYPWTYARDRLNKMVENLRPTTVLDKSELEHLESLSLFQRCLNTADNKIDISMTKNSLPHDTHVLIRETAVDSAIIIAVELTNPLQIVLECKNFKVYGYLAKKEVSVLSSSTPMLSGLDSSFNRQFYEDPFLLDDQELAGIVTFVPQTITLNPHETVQVMCTVIPHEPGRLWVNGFRWDLYGVARIYKPITLWKRKKPIKTIIGEKILSTFTEDYFDSFFFQAGTLPVSSNVSSLLMSAPIETELSSTLHSEITNLTPPLILKQALLLSQLTSDVTRRARLLLLKETAKNLIFDISTAIPRIQCFIENWPQHTLLHGQEHEAQLIIQNTGKTPITSLQIIATPKQIVFFSNSLTCSTEYDNNVATNHYYHYDSISCYEKVILDIILRGSDVGIFLVGICIIANSITMSKLISSPTTTTLHQTFKDDTNLLHHPLLGSCPQLADLSSETLTSSTPTFISSETSRTPPSQQIISSSYTNLRNILGYKVILLERLLYTKPSLNISLSHHASWKDCGAYIVVAQIRRAALGMNQHFQKLSSSSNSTYNATSEPLTSLPINNYHHSSSTPLLNDTSQLLLLNNNNDDDSIKKNKIDSNNNDDDNNNDEDSVFLVTGIDSFIPLHNLTPSQQYLQIPLIPYQKNNDTLKTFFSKNKEEQLHFTKTSNNTNYHNKLSSPIKKISLFNGSSKTITSSFSKPMTIPISPDHYFQGLFMLKPFLTPEDVEPPIPCRPQPNMSYSISENSSPELKMFNVVRHSTLQTEKRDSIKQHYISQITTAGEHNKLHTICKLKKNLPVLLNQSENDTTLAPPHNDMNDDNNNSLHGITPAIDFIVHWVRKSRTTAKILATGDQYIYGVPLFIAIASCPLKFQLHPIVPTISPSLAFYPERQDPLSMLAKNIASLYKGNFNLGNVKLTLHNISETAKLSIVIETDGEASCRGLPIHHQGTTENASGETSKVHRQWMMHIKNVINTAVRSKDAPAFFGASANRFPASGIFWIGRTSFSLTTLKPGDVLSTSMTLCCPSSGLFNLNKFRFLVRTIERNDSQQEEKIFAFPFERLLSTDHSSFIFKE